MNEVSQYFETLSSGIDWDTETRCGRFTLTLKPAATPLGTHYQFIQSTVDLSRVRSEEQLVSAILHGNCRDLPEF
ncbi:MAG: hypothetical protein EHM68_11300 [Lysobacterales bacterium]|nr:MAG: hypothetical protein EHM68_11300 [Xanthomonadales bacterium]